MSCLGLSYKVINNSIWINNLNFSLKVSLLPQFHHSNWQTFNHFLFMPGLVAGGRRKYKLPQRLKSTSPATFKLFIGCSFHTPFLNSDLPPSPYKKHSIIVSLHILSFHTFFLFFAARLLIRLLWYPVHSLLSGLLRMHYMRILSRQPEASDVLHHWPMS